jgi:plasmid maintenance system killer protein
MALGGERAAAHSIRRNENYAACFSASTRSNRVPERILLLELLPLSKNSRYLQ